METPDFSELEPFSEAWGLPTTHDRLVKRLASTFKELQAFHAAMTPRLDEIIAFLNEFPMDDIPERYQPLSYMALAMCEVDDAVCKWGSPTSPAAASPLRFASKKSFYDNKPVASGIEELPEVAT